MNEKRKLILVIDDEAGIRNYICDVADELGFATEQAGTLAESLELNERSRPEIILMDLNMPDSEVGDRLEALAMQGTKANIVLMSGTEIGELVTVQDLGKELELTITDVVEKPISLTTLENLLEQG